MLLTLLSLILLIICITATNTKPLPSNLQTNWANNVDFNTSTILVPQSTEEVQHAIINNPRVRVLGTRHSFNNILASAADDGILMVTSHLDEVISCCENDIVTVQPGITYGKLGKYLWSRGYSVKNLASLPHISVGGAISTATHGSGTRIGNLASHVASFQLVDAQGTLLSSSKANQPEDNDLPFEAGVVSVGRLGVFSEIGIEIVPAFHVTQCIYHGFKLEQFQTLLDMLAVKAYSFSFFLNWNPEESFSSVWVKLNTSNHVELAHRPVPALSTFGSWDNRSETPDTWYAHASAPAVGTHGQYVQNQPSETAENDIKNIKEFDVFEAECPAELLENVAFQGIYISTYIHRYIYIWFKHQ